MLMKMRGSSFKTFGFSLIKDINDYIYLCLHLCVCARVHAHMCVQAHRYQQYPDEDIRSPGTGVTSGCELPDMSTGVKTWVPSNS